MTVVDLLCFQVRTARDGAQKAAAGMSHADSLVRPQPAGNSFNWVVGHLLATYDQLLPRLGQPAVRPDGALARYARGAPPMAHDEDALPLDQLLRDWATSCGRVDAGIATLSSKRLAERVLDGPSGDPNETVASMLALVCFHQAYHVGQLGLLRRVAGKERAFG
jgi:hypothetical protein